MFKFRHKVITIAVFIFLLFLTGFAGFLRSKYVVPVLMYHSVNSQGDPKRNPLMVTPRTFEKQMRFLKQHKYNVLPLEVMADLIRSGKKLPARLVAITLDDGYKDNYTYAFPILKKYGMPATMFIITQEVGRPDRLSWDEINQMRASGIITFGSHTLGPEPLTKIKSEAEVKRQIFDSKKVMEEKLGSAVTMFSYPEGRFNDKIKQLVKDAGYKLAVATSPGKKYSSNDVFLIKRLRISENAADLVVFWFETNGFYTLIKENRHK
jgi:peptidoglycan/xylan/chitin deacetylase (PgdA/CDA1 family)